MKLTPAEAAERREKILALLDHCQAGIEKIDREKEQFRHLWWSLLLVFPLTYFWSFFGTIAAVVNSLLLWTIGQYLLRVRRREYHHTIAEFERELSRLPAPE